MKELLNILVSLLVINQQLLHAQSSADGLPRYVVKNWNNRSGLPQNTVFDLATDAEGYLWIATNEGLCRFDGDHFELFTRENTTGLYSNTFNDLVTGRNNTLWAASWNSILQINKNDITPYDLRKETEGSWISRIAEDKTGRLWIGTTTGRLYVLENGAVKKVQGWELEETVSIQAMVAYDGGVLIGTNKGLFYAARLTSPALPLPGFEKADIRALANGRAQTVWIGTKEQGLYFFDGKQAKQYGEKHGLKESFIYSLAVAPDSSVWVGTSSSGVQVLRNERFHSLPENGFSLDGLKCIFFSAPNLAWLGTPASGLLQLKPGNVRMLNDKMLSGNIILPIYQHPNGDVWVGTAGQGINRISKGKVSVLNSKNGLSNEIVLTVFGTPTDILIGTPRGLNRFNLQKEIIDRVFTTEDGLASNVIQSVLYSSDQKTWIATRAGGLHQLTGDKIKRIALPTPLANAELTALFEDRKKNIWVGSTGAGVACIRPDGSSNYYRVDQGESSNIVYDFYEGNKSVIWMASEAGLLGFDGRKFSLYTKKNGLQFNSLYRLIDDGVGNLWLSGNFGLQRLFIKELQDLDAANGNAHLSTRLFDNYDGMNNAEANGNVFPAGWRMKDGSLWFPTIDGIARLNPGRITNLEKPLIVKIQLIEYSNERKKTIESVVVPPHVSSLSIHYTALDFTQPHTINYHYRLKGLSDEWENAGNRNTAYFTSLDPGNYQFEVRAEQYGQWSEIATYDFSIKAVFFQTPWFKVLLMAVLIGLGVLVHKYYDHAQRKKLLEQVVSKRTQELKESNTRYQVVNSELTRSREAYQSLFFQNPYAVFSLDLQGNFMKANGVMSELTGYSMIDLLKKPFRQLIELNHRHLVQTDFTRPGTQGAHSYQTKIITAKQHLLEVDVTHLPIIVEGKVTGMYGIIKDITQQVRAEEQLRNLNANLEEKVSERTGQLETVNKELEAFSYSVSHDLRAPLRAIGSYAQLLAEDHQEHLDEDGKDILLNIRYNARRMSYLIDELLSFSRLGRKDLEKSEVDMNELVREVVTHIKNESHTGTEIKIGNLPRVHADYKLMYQVLYNLVTNAVKYSSKKENPLVEIYDSQRDGKDVIVVQDNGAGFDMRYADKLFGVFQRLHSEKDFEGTGVGLAIVKRIINKHGGTVWGEAKENEGAKFSFTLN